MHVRMGGGLVDGFNDPARLTEDAVEKFSRCAQNVARMAATDLVAHVRRNNTTHNSRASLDQERGIAWLVASDSNKALELLREHAATQGILMRTFEGGRRVHTDSMRETRYVNEKDYLQVFVDWFTLTRCDFLVLTRSTFGLTAKNYGRNPWQLMNVNGSLTDMADDYQLCFPEDR